ncbi:hypothetical protein [Ruminococcus sp.]|uniref:hypothetical protein n=1 Tax=Ruminococcus sp. TaxID=41978 RepID=UPI0025DE774F|nr:hypothetical protein [Ruminococcus sp.]MBQ6253022.1 hypothetical protein [Ruminococcus sp.]
MAQANNKPIRIERVWAMPNKNTFKIKPIERLIGETVDLSLLWIDPFANQNKIASVTNDLNTDYDTDYHLDALEFLKMFDDNSVDGVLYDPPYSPRQVSECYNDVGYSVTWDTTKASFWGNHKREISRIVKIGGRVITFGWNSGGIGNKYGFEIERILLVPHGGWHNDTICTVEIKTHEGCFEKTKITLKKTGEEPMLTANDKELIAALKKLPIDYWDFRDDDTKEYTHGLHNYPAMMVCPISRNIIRLVRDIQPIHALFDPFAGSGTVLVEGMVNGIETVSGNDINPLALLLSKVKTTPLNNKQLTTEVDQLLKRISQKRKSNSSALDDIDSYCTDILHLDLTDKKGWGDKAHTYLRDYCESNDMDICIPAFKNMGYWFRPRVVLELAIIKSEIEKIENKDIRDFCFVAMSETIRFVSNRRNGEFKMFRMPAAKVQAFNPDVYDEFRKILLRNVAKMNDFCEVLESNASTSSVSVFNNNVCSLFDVADDTYDLIITSPPYGDSRTTVAYGEYSRLSLQWINLFELSEKEIMGVDKSLMGGKKYRNGFEFTLNSETLRASLEKIKDEDIERAGDVYSFYADLDAALRNVAQKTKSGGYQFWVVGNRTVKKELLQTDVIITELAPQYGLVPVHTVDRNIPNKVMPTLNSPTNITGAKGSTMTMEHIVILRKQ